MRKRKASPLNLHKETVRMLDGGLEKAAGGNTFLCSYTCFSCPCDHKTKTEGTDCCY